MVLSHVRLETCLVYTAFYTNSMSGSVQTEINKYQKSLRTKATEVSNLLNFNRSMRFLYLLKSKLKQSELGIVVCFLVLQSSALCCITLGSSEPRAPSPHFQRVLIRNSGEIGRLLFLLVIRMSNFTKTFSHPFQTKQTTHNKKTTANHN